jgi:hypothetical protein
MRKTIIIHKDVDTSFGNRCSKCNKRLDAAMGVGALDSNPVPQPGAISICGYCGGINIFGENRRFLPPDPAEEQRILEELKRVQPDTYALLIAMQQQFAADRAGRQN